MDQQTEQNYTYAVTCTDGRRQFIFRHHSASVESLSLFHQTIGDQTFLELPGVGPSGDTVLVNALHVVSIERIN